MRTPRAVITGLSMLPLLTGAALAQQSEERYRLERTEDGYVRMDTLTGAMTLCQERGGELACRPASQTGETGSANVAAGTSGAAEIEALRQQVAELEKRVQALESNGGVLDVPLEQEFEQSLNFMERFFRRFIDIVKDLNQEEPAQNSAPAERT